MKRSVTINFNFDKKFVYFFASLLLVTLVLGGVYAAFSSTGQYHDAGEVKVTIDGTDYSLQDVIDGGLLGSKLNNCEIIQEKTTNYLVETKCPVGKKVISGGFDYPGGEDDPMIESKPLQDFSGWKCKTYKTGKKKDKICYAICC